MYIQIKYRINGGNDWLECQLSAEEYFDLEPDEVPAFDSVPWHNHACDYLKLPTTGLAETQITVDDDRHGQRIIIRETFWNEGRNRLIERSDSGQRSNYRELILLGVVGEAKSEVLRLVDTKCTFNLGFHSMIEKNADGTETEHKYFEFSPGNGSA